MGGSGQSTPSVAARTSPPIPHLGARDGQDVQAGVLLHIACCQTRFSACACVNVCCGAMRSVNCFSGDCASPQIAARLLHRCLQQSTSQVVLPMLVVVGLDLKQMTTRQVQHCELGSSAYQAQVGASTILIGAEQASSGCDMQAPVKTNHQNSSGKQTRHCKRCWLVRV